MNLFTLISTLFAFSMRFCLLSPVIKMFVSSAQRTKFMSLSVKQFVMSLIYKRNNNGPSTYPCGTPNNTCSMADFSTSS